MHYTYTDVYVYIYNIPYTQNGWGSEPQTPNLAHKFLSTQTDRPKKRGKGRFSLANS